LTASAAVTLETMDAMAIRRKEYFILPSGVLKVMEKKV
jgi:hypothetical protein